MVLKLLDLKNLLFLMFGFAGFIATCCAQGKTAEKPNIILIMADDLGYNDIEPYGSSQVSTPHLQQLASEGMSFDNMFTSTAMCSPTRQQILTGLYPVRNGAYPNHSFVYKGTKSVAHYMQNAGYETAIIGKRDFGNAKSFPFKFLGGRDWDNGKGKAIDLADAKNILIVQQNLFFWSLPAINPMCPGCAGMLITIHPEE